MQYEWIVVGGGIAGISFSEILTRQGHSVLLVEKNAQLASEVTKGFNEVTSDPANFSDPNHFATGVSRRIFDEVILHHFWLARKQNRK
jgi:glycine/D-amino acid oxidase-like deaminating enzyme